MRGRGSNELPEDTRVRGRGSNELPEDTRVRRRGSNELPEDTRVRGRGSNELPEGTRVRGRGSNRLPEGTRVRRRGSNRLPEGTRVRGRGSNRLPEGTRVRGRGSNRLPEGTRVRGRGSNRLPESTRVRGRGSNELPEGTRVDRRGSDQPPRAPSSRPPPHVDHLAPSDHAWRVRARRQRKGRTNSEPRAPRSSSAVGASDEVQPRASTGGSTRCGAENLPRGGAVHRRRSIVLGCASVHAPRFVYLDFSVVISSSVRYFGCPRQTTFPSRTIAAAGMADTA